jgi:hypothetical protein
MAADLRDIFSTPLRNDSVGGVRPEILQIGKINADKNGFLSLARLGQGLQNEMGRELPCLTKYLSGKVIRGIV